jgi:hypothetical protein
MAIYDNLPVYKTSYDLLIELFKLVKNFSREWKFTIGEEIKKETIEMILNIYRANSSWEKKEKIQKARENIETIRMMLRLLKDLKQVGLERFINLNEKIESVSKQLAGWQNSQKN